MKKILGGGILGGALSYCLIKWSEYTTPVHEIDATEFQTINNYISEHKLRTSFKYALMQAYMKSMKSFLNYGVVEQIKGFSYIETFFKEGEEETNINNLHCIFNPNGTVCGHPTIQHGGMSATLVDQTSGALAMLHSMNMVATYQLTIKYLKPIHKGESYIINATVKKAEGRDIIISSTIQSLETKTKVLEAEVWMKTVQWEHKMADVFKYLFQNSIQHKHEPTQSK